MKKALVKIIGITPLAQGKHVTVPKKNKESEKDYEVRTWREKMHYNDKGEVLISQFALKNCLSEAAKYLSIQVPGKGKATYTKNFEAGIAVELPMPIGINKDDVESQIMFVPSDGVRGSNKRVEKHFPVIPPGWSGLATFFIFDDIITEDVFKLHLEQAGTFIGLGSFRPRNNGYFGRFKIEIQSWQDTE